MGYIERIHVVYLDGKYTRATGGTGHSGETAPGRGANPPEHTQNRGHWHAERLAIALLVALAVSLMTGTAGAGPFYDDRLYTMEISASKAQAMPGETLTMTMTIEIIANSQGTFDNCICSVTGPALLKFGLEAPDKQVVIA